jgi:uncharacterized protein YjbI with pentapeptide repeats
MVKLTREDVERIVKEAREKGEIPDLRESFLVELDLSKTSLSEANLTDANLSGADLDGTNFSGAVLSKAILSQANLSKTNFSNADLRETNLNGANLQKAYLYRANLGRANLSRANLGRANLINANLNWANLNRTDLSEADLSEAHVRGAHLVGADLCKTHLVGAHLVGTHLVGADLSSANLSKADLSNSYTGGTVFVDVDLSTIKGLDTVQHHGPSHIDTHTLVKSKGKIPISFLRGCGLSDLQIEMAKLHTPDLTEKEITDITHKLHNLLEINTGLYHSCFISHSTKDEAFVRQLYNDLQENGVRCWYVPEKLKGEQQLYPQIDQAIHFRDKLLLILSKYSLQSEWIDGEVQRARLAEMRDDLQKLFPLRLVDMQAIESWKSLDAKTGNDVAAEVREYHIPDFSMWRSNPNAYRQVFAQLLDDLKSDKPPPPSLPAKAEARALTTTTRRAL